MDMSGILVEPAPLVTTILAALCLILLVALHLRYKPFNPTAIVTVLEGLIHEQERLEGVMHEESARGRAEHAQAAQALRGELLAMVHALGDTVSGRVSIMAAQQKDNLEGVGRIVEKFSQSTEANLTRIRDAMEKRLSEILQAEVEASRTTREESANSLKQFGESMENRMSILTGTNEQRLGELRASVETKLSQIQTDNAARLEEMRKTVDEKLQGTLEKRLGQSFQLVSERLELVHKGLGEMQTLAAGVGDLKKVLTNVKTRGTWGEVQLERLLEQIFAPGQFVKNFSPNGRETVEFAVRMAGREGEVECMLPIDAKYPVEDYERLLAAVEAGSPEAADAASRQIEMRIKACAKDIREKYICPPITTIFAVLFLPVEGLYAEVLRRPGLVEALQRDFRVVIAGPTTLTAILSSVQMGLAVAAISKRSEEVWKTLGAVKLEFRKYGDVLDKVKKSLTSASNQLDSVSTRSRAIERKLRSVTELPESESRQMLMDIKDIMGDMAAEEPA